MSHGVRFALASVVKVEILQKLKAELKPLVKPGLSPIEFTCWQVKKSFNITFDFTARLRSFHNNHAPYTIPTTMVCFPKSSSPPSLLTLTI